MTDTESKPSPTMEDFEQILGYLDGDYESRCEGVQRLRDAFQTLLSENAELKRRPTREQVRTWCTELNMQGNCAALAVARGEVETCFCGKCTVEKLLSQLYPAESEKE